MLRQRDVLNPFHYRRDRGKLYGQVGRRYFTVSRLLHNAPWLPVIVGRVSQAGSGADLVLLFFLLGPTVSIAMFTLVGTLAWAQHRVWSVFFIFMSVFFFTAAGGVVTVRKSCAQLRSFTTS